jgi:competence ComEA-like helix-hairpin-helix protein
MENLKDYFYFNRHERNGAIILLVLCLAIGFAPQLYPWFIPEEPLDYRAIRQAEAELKQEDNDAKAPVINTAPFPFDPNTASRETLRKLQLNDRTITSIINYRNKGGKFRTKEDFSKIYTLREADYKRLAPFIVIQQAVSVNPAPRMVDFDPNTASAADLGSLGIPERVIRSILNYREKGGRYRKKEDLKKIYSLAEAEYLRIEPYINIAGSTDTADARPAFVQKAISIDINTATAAEWQTLNGIGPAYAAKIVRFRELLGGFASINQVAETRQLPDSTFQKIAPYLKASSIVRPIHINDASAEILAAHPYIDRKSALAIVAWRTQNGPFSGEEDLKKLYALSAETIVKIRPYILYTQ